jgi:Tol biopolymer transport system component
MWKPLVPKLFACVLTATIFGCARIAYSWTPAGSSDEIGHYDLETLVQVRLTNNGLVRDHHPRVSAKGDQILYQRGVEIWVMGIDGSDPHFVVKGDDPTWAPDGSKFAFVYQPDSAVPGLGTLWVSDVNGSDPEQLTGPYPPVD